MKTKVFAFLLVAALVLGGRAEDVRAYWVDELCRLADPVLTSYAEGRLEASLPPRRAVNKNAANAARIEAVGRLLAGMAPWLELPRDDSAEGQLREKYLALAHEGLGKMYEPGSPDLFFVGPSRQPLVDLAYLAHAFLRSPNRLWGELDETTKTNLIATLRSTRAVKPYQNNWQLFASMVEVFLLETTGECDETRLFTGVDMFMTEWYAGDGEYQDGVAWHHDYYNSFVINPMLYEILRVAAKHNLRSGDSATWFKKHCKRVRRSAVCQERLISPEGTYPVIGRSGVYRGGSFQTLALAALLGGDMLTPKPGAVRAGLTAVLKRLSVAENYDANGWIVPGVIGSQPDLCDTYISAGSCYMQALMFLPLGLPADAPFWTDPDADWTQKAIWSGSKTVKGDHFTTD